MRACLVSRSGERAPDWWWHAVATAPARAPLAG